MTRAAASVREFLRRLLGYEIKPDDASWQAKPDHRLTGREQSEQHRMSPH